MSRPYHSGPFISAKSIVVVSQDLSYTDSFIEASNRACWTNTQKMLDMVVHPPDWSGRFRERPFQTPLPSKWELLALTVRRSQSRELFVMFQLLWFITAFPRL